MKKRKSQKQKHSTMYVIALAGQKGGSGKSTVAIHLAALAQSQGRETLLADLDPHSQTAAEWGSERTQALPVIIRATADDLAALLAQAEDEGFDLVLLDLPPTSTRWCAKPRGGPTSPSSPVDPFLRTCAPCPG